MRKTHIWASFLVLLGAFSVILAKPPIQTILENLALDAFQRHSPRQYRETPVRIIDIDEESLARFGQWPWPRNLLAELTHRLNRMGASVIVFDMVFAEPDRTSPRSLLRNLSNQDKPATLPGNLSNQEKPAALPGKLPYHDKLVTLLGELPDHDMEFAEAMAGAPVVTGFSCASVPLSGKPPVSKARFVTAGDDPLPFLPRFRGASANLPLLEDAARGNGTFTYTADHDGVVRHAPLILRMGDTLFPSLSLEALRVAKGAANIVVTSSGAHGENRFGGHTGIVNIRVNDLVIPTDPEGNAWLHYSRNEAERYIPAWRILSGKADPQRITGAILFVGTSAKGLQDLRFSPVSGVIPGVEIHAQLTEQLMTDSHIKRPDWAPALTVLFLSGMWGLLALVSGRTGAAGLAVIVVGGILLTLALSHAAFTRATFFIDPLFPSVTLIAMYGICGFIRFMGTERERRWIRKAFSSYISPNLVEHLVKHPEQLNLGGEVRICSFVLTDLAGFTAFMEKTDPSTVAHVLNDYIEEMLRIAFSFDATLDRIIGDSIALMFSAPVTQPDHARRAVSCALAMDAFSQRFVKETREKGIPLGITRIGVHTGEVLVGNFGGSAMIDYRALGDPINTCARLETLNKHLGTRVCVSRQTADMCEGFRGRPAGNLVFKGKTVGIDVFEPLEETADGKLPETSAYMDAYGMLEREEPGTLNAFHALVKDNPDDPLSLFHLRRLQKGESGVTVIMTEK